ncbi:MAG TPA: hypothetical protein VF571_16980 [Pyrinomonadaceae bacterium]|jgi:hypothetical protein
MQTRSYKEKLELITNIAVLVMVMVLFGVFGYKFLFQQKQDHSGLRKGAILSNLEGVDVKSHEKTLLLALSTECSYCTQSLEFYKKLVGSINQNSKKLQVLALFSQSPTQVDNYLSKHQFSGISTISNVNYQKLEIPVTPAIILLDSNNEIINSWTGVLKENREKDVLLTVNDIFADSPSLATTDVGIKTIDIFNENGSIMSISPQLKNDNRPSFINYLDVDAKENIYFTAYDSLYKYDSTGKFIKNTKIAVDSKGLFCVDKNGNVYLSVFDKLLVYDTNLTLFREIQLDLPLTKESQVLKMVIDNTSNLYIQTLSQNPLNQTLYKVNLTTNQATIIHRLEKPVPFTPTYAPGAFDFAISEKHIFVSDIYEYKIYVYNSINGSQLKTFRRNYSADEILPSHGILPIRKMTIGNLTDDNKLKKYPPIAHLNISNSGDLLVWTFRRADKFRNVVHIYDSDFNLKGADLKYMHPAVSNYKFINNKVYVPDFGFGRAINTSDVSPLEIPSKPYSIKVFDEINAHQINQLNSK